MWHIPARISDTVRLFNNELHEKLGRLQQRAPTEVPKSDSQPGEHRFSKAQRETISRAPALRERGVLPLWKNKAFLRRILQGENPCREVWRADLGIMAEM